MKYSHTIVISLIIAACVAGGLYFYFSRGTNLGLSSASPALFGTTSPSGTPQGAQNAGLNGMAPLPETYTDSDYGFSFQYPENYEVNPLVSADGRTILTAGQKGNLGFGFQVIITPFDEPASHITAARIAHDIPGMEVKDPTPFSIGTAAQGLSFQSTEDTGPTREIWFVAGGNLYQVTAPIGFDAILQQIMSTWQFK